MDLIFSESFKKYISKCDNTICRHLYDHINYGHDSELFTAENINYITFRTDGTISYLPKGKTHVYDTNDWSIWKRDNRQNGASSKVIRKIITKKGLELFKDSDFETFTNCYKSEFNDDGLRFELKENIDIPNIYNDSNIMEGDGTLNGSCMNGNSNSCFDIYKYCKDLKMLCLFNNDDELCGRALVWKLSDTITFMDRVYIVKDFYTEKFIEYASNNKWIRKERQSYDYKESFVDCEGKVFNKTYKINLNTNYDSYPYIDTFTYGGDGWLTNNDENNHEYTYTCTGGERENCNEEDDDDHCGEIYDDIDDCYIDEDDAYHIDKGDRAGEMTHRRNVVRINDNYWYIEDDNIIEVGGECYLKDGGDLEYCSVNNEYYVSSDCVLITEGMHEGNYIHEDDVKYDVNDNAWYKNDPKLVYYDDNWYDVDSQEYQDLV